MSFSISISYIVLVLSTSHKTVCQRCQDKFYPNTVCIIILQPGVYLVVFHIQVLFFALQHVTKTAAKIVQRHCFSASQSLPFVYAIHQMIMKEECEVSRILDIGHWTFEYQMSEMTELRVTIV